MPAIKNRFPSVDFVIAGHGADEKRLRKLTVELDIVSCVKFFGTLSKNRLAKLFQASEIFVVMSTSETQCMALIQSMACGLPAIGAKSRALPEFIPEGTGFLVGEQDSTMLAERILLLLSNRKLRSQLGSRAHHFAQAFSIEKIVDHWENLYRQVLAARESRRETYRTAQCRPSETTIWPIK
jgi:glycosyltransferase involved in cell wall biosynthesis